MWNESIGTIGDNKPFTVIHSSLPILSNLLSIQANEVNLAKHSLKLVSAIFYQILIFSSNDSPLKNMKNVFYII